MELETLKTAMKRTGLGVAELIRMSEDKDEICTALEELSDNNVGTPKKGRTGRQEFRVHGASDDLIEVDGDFSEEFGQDEGYLLFDDGTILHVKYEDPGLWKVRELRRGKKVESLEIDVCEEETEEGYSDTAKIVANGLEWILCLDADPSELAREQTASIPCTARVEASDPPTDRSAYVPAT